MMRISFVFLLWIQIGAVVTGLASPPSGLLCDLQKHPALGVRSVPQFGWIVPSCSNGYDHVQTAYRIRVSSNIDGDLVWDSGKVITNQSNHIPYGGQSLHPGTPYNWTVQTWTNVYDGSGRSCRSVSSTPATFLTSLFQGWSPLASFVGIEETSNATFAYVRREVSMNATDLKSAIGFITARTAPQLLCGYRLYVNGNLVDVGPGRGEAPVWDGDSTFRSLPYSTLDLTTVFQQAATTSDDAVVIALQVMQYKQAPSVMMQVHLYFHNDSASTLVTDDDSWLGFNADLHRNPGPPQHGGSAGTGFLEYVDARHEPVGWMLPGFQEGEDWQKFTARKPSESDLQSLHSKMEPPLQLSSINVRSLKRISRPNRPTFTEISTTYIADFGKEFQGGLRLQVEDGVAGQTVHIACGESLDQNDTVGYTWGWEFDWILRNGSQFLEQHKYMECRYVSLTFRGLRASAVEFSLSAWKVNYPWDERDSYFYSNDSILNAVWELCRCTVEAGSLDTYTDSNTRERMPYEADGMIAATARLMVQRDYLWARHSHAYVLQYPTWPVEWMQLSPLLGWQDYMATGQVDLSLAFTKEMYNRTMIGFLDPSLGLLDTSNMGRHIVDWMPDATESDQTVERHEFTASSHMSVSNMFAAHGLDLLAQLMSAGGRTEESVKIATEAKRLKESIFKHMWNRTAFCDGICSEVGGNSLVMTNMFSLCLGMVPDENLFSVWRTVANWGLEQMGDYGAFWYQTALASGYYAPPYDTPDDGSAIYKALTKCDMYSWCSGLREDGLTMTRESWHDGTYSHPWGASAIVGIVWGIMGIHQTAPGFATFTVKPKLGGLRNATITVPTLHGYIHVKATTAPLSTLEVQIPCNTIATLCLPVGHGFPVTSDTRKLESPNTALLLDDKEVAAHFSEGHFCASQPVGCGINGQRRRLCVRRM